MVWDWGWTWQQISISQGNIGFNISGAGGDTGQGTGSVSIIDSVFTQTTIGILTNNLPTSPNIVLDNTVFDSVPSPIVTAVGGTSLISGSPDLWATGARYNGSVGSSQTGTVVGAPARASGLVDSATGFLFVRDRPQYEKLASSDFLVATRDGGCANDGTGDQTTCLNTFLQAAVAAGQVAYFPAGIYLVGGTVFVPTGSKLQGSSWSQIQGAGFYFRDMTNPQVMIQVGNKGDIGSMEVRSDHYLLAHLCAHIYATPRTPSKLTTARTHCRLSRCYSRCRATPPVPSSWNGTSPPTRRARLPCGTRISAWVVVLAPTLTKAHVPNSATIRSA